jgi:hypothetical protein
VTLKNRKEDKLIKDLTRLVKKQIQSDRTLSFNEAFKRVIDENPQISNDIKEIEIELIRRKIIQGL